MSGWIVAAVLALGWILSKRKNTKQRTEMANLIILLFLDRDSYSNHREAFVAWLDQQPANKKMELWLEANNAVERMVRSWAADLPTTIGVSQVIWEEKEKQAHP